MSGRQLRLIFGTLAALLMVYLAVRLGSSDRRSAVSEIDLGAAVDSGTALIRALGPGDADSVRLERRGRRWMVNGYPADSSLIDEALTTLDTASTSRLVARSAVNHARLGVEEGVARRIEIGPPGAPEIAFLLGGSGREGRYLRLVDAPEVYVISSPAVDPLDRGVEGWRDRLIAAVDTASVGEIRIRRSAEEVVLRRTVVDSVTRWTVGETPADSATATRILAAVTALRATGFPSDSEALSADFDNPTALLELFAAETPTPEGGVPLLSLLFVRLEDEGAFLVRRADRPLVYRLRNWMAERIVPRREELLGEE